MSEPYAAMFAQEQAEPPPATRPNPKDAIKSETLWITVGLLALVLIIGAVVLSAVDKWRKRASKFGKEAVEEMTNLRELYEAGEITHNEYERIRNKLAGRVKETIGVKPTAPSVPPGEIGPGTNGPPQPPDNGPASNLG